MAAAVEQVAWYGDPESLELRDEIARRHGVTAENVSVGAGIDDLLGLAVRVLLAPGDAGIGPRGGYPIFPFHVAGYGGRLTTVPYRDDRCDLPGLAAAARRHEARLVYLANPDNPSGSVVPAAGVAAFLDELPEGAVLLLDQAYAELAPSAEPAPTAALGLSAELSPAAAANAGHRRRPGDLLPYFLESLRPGRSTDRLRAGLAGHRRRLRQGAGALRGQPGGAGRRPGVAPRPRLP